MEKNLVKVIIPIYRNLHSDEQAALDHNLNLLNGLPAAFIKPVDYDITALSCQYPDVEVINVSNQWLGHRGIQGYNEMMMSEQFYAMFADCEYIFICHVDAWLFRNEVTEWCQRGYDLVAAPWPTRPRYEHFPLKQYLQLKMWLKPARKILHCQMFGRIGNGGLCLRKVKTFQEACRQYAVEINYYMSHHDDLHNEDLFWALVPRLDVPTVADALQFSFDLKPQLCYQLNEHRLPMACHGFNKPNRADFWSHFIPCLPKASAAH